MNPNIRYPAVAEAHYPAEPQELEGLVHQLLDPADEPGQNNRSIRAIMAPHAAYNLSGRTAATAYKTISRKRYDSVFILGDTHAFFFDGIAADSRHEWLTPLESVPVNRTVNDKLCSAAPDLIRLLDIAHDADHVLELQLPFLQLCIEKGFSIVPLLFGNDTSDRLPDIADLLLTVVQPGDLIVVSTDLSHYPSYSKAIEIDRETLDAIVSLDLERLEANRKKLAESKEGETIGLFCSPDSVTILMLIARKLGWKAELLSYSNSGDSPHDDKSEVVGYGAVIFFEEIPS